MKDKTNKHDELLDLVDEKDRVIGEVQKDLANRNPKLFHREVGVLIYDEESRVLIQQRSFEKTVEPGFWTTSCAGHIPKGTSPEDTAHVELKEELDFDTDLKFIEKILIHHPHETHFAYLYIGKYPRSKITLNREEVIKAKFISKEEFKNLKISEKVNKATKKVLKRFFAGEFDEQRLSSVSGV